MPLPPPTRLERFIQMRIRFCLFGKYLGTGHLRDHDTDTESESSERSDVCILSDSEELELILARVY